MAVSDPALDRLPELDGSLAEVGGGFGVKVVARRRRMSMRTVNMRYAKTHLSRLVTQAVKGDAFLIAKYGKPLVKVMPLDLRHKPGRKRLGFLAGEVIVPDDFNRIGQNEIERRFGCGA